MQDEAKTGRTNDADADIPDTPDSEDPGLDDAILVAASRTRHAQETVAGELAGDHVPDEAETETVVTRATDLETLAHQAHPEGRP
jgi:hypothetical protein